MKEEEFISLINSEFSDEYKLFIIKSIFEFKESKYNEDKIKDIDFLLGQSFIEKEVVVVEIDNIKILKKEEKETLFIKDNNENQDFKNNIKALIIKEKELLNMNIKKFFKIIDIDNKSLIGFDELITFIKQLQLFSILNNNSITGIIKSSNVYNSKQLTTYPALNKIENSKIVNLDDLNCGSIDFLMFFDYMIDYLIFRNYQDDPLKNTINEKDITICLDRMFLRSDKIQGVIKYGNSYDSEAVLKYFLNKKCIINKESIK